VLIEFMLLHSELHLRFSDKSTVLSVTILDIVFEFQFTLKY